MPESARKEHVLKNLNQNDNSERARWGEKHEEPLKFDVKIRPGFIQIGDEFFDVAELEAEEMKRLQPESHPFKPKHYLSQNELNKINAYFKRGQR